MKLILVLFESSRAEDFFGFRKPLLNYLFDMLFIILCNKGDIDSSLIYALEQWCSNRGPQGPMEWPAKQFSLERKLSTLIS